MEIIPAILESTWLEVEKKIKLVDGLVDWIQLDVSDGQFTSTQTWCNSPDLFLIKSNLNIEVHLMINKPWLVASGWFSSPAKRVVVQVEAFASPQSVRFNELIFLAKRYGKEIVWAFKVETPWQSYEELLQKPDTRVLFLSVEPGRQGQEFDERVLEKISSLKSAHSNVKIAVDGGINLNNIESIKSTGADSAVIGSGIFGAADLKQVILDLKKGTI
jgi:ribulose-phosphate 3-epimerase